jgi:predicted nucleotidyltransferase
MTETGETTGYRAGLRRAYAERMAVLERERLDLLERVRPAGDALRHLGAAQVLLFGSILRAGYFDRASDIDILVSGLPDELLWRALSTVERATGIYDRDINLVFDQMASPDLAAEARKSGIVL